MRLRERKKKIDMMISEGRAFLFLVLLKKHNILVYWNSILAAITKRNLWNWFCSPFPQLQRVHKFSPSTLYGSTFSQPLTWPYCVDWTEEISQFWQLCNYLYHTLRKGWEPGRILTVAQPALLQNGYNAAVKWWSPQSKNIDLNLPVNDLMRIPCKLF